MQCRELCESATKPGTYLVRGLFLILFLAVAVFPQTAAANHKMHISRNDNGTEITVSRDDLVDLSLASQGATGYLWRFDRIDPDYIDLVGDKTARESAPGVTGAPVIHTWTLRMKKAGSTEVRMSYCRPWEGNDQAAETFTVRIRIIPGNQ